VRSGLSSARGRAALLALGLVACRSGEPDGEAPASSESAICGAGATYENFAGPFFLSWCTGCHGTDLGEGERQNAPFGVDFDTRAGVESHSARVLQRVVVDRTMPPAGGPADAERALLADWIACKMPAENPYFDPGAPAHADSPPEADARECAQARKPLPAALLPRCAASTRTCRERCAVQSPQTADGDVVEACRKACLESDPTPPALLGGGGAGSAVNCSACNLLQLLACGEEVGCHSQVAALMCCIEDCKQSGDASCVEARCRGAIDSFGQCVYYRGEKCLKDDGELSSACFSR
jgi:hypothetical protein